jgi:hypothetical protein
VAAHGVEERVQPYERHDGAVSEGVDDQAQLGYVVLRPVFKGFVAILVICQDPRVPNVVEEVEFAIRARDFGAKTVAGERGVGRDVGVVEWRALFRELCGDVVFEFVGGLDIDVNGVARDVGMEVSDI